MMRRVIIESPYAGHGWLAPLQRQRNIRYARRCMYHSLLRGEAPLLSHLLYPQVLRDADKVERMWGINAGLSWGELADLWAVYTDRGVSAGMDLGVAFAKAHNIDIEYRTLGTR
jgi:hypothetical protein